MWICGERPQRSRILLRHWNKDGGLIGEEHMIGATKIHSWNATLIWCEQLQINLHMIWYMNVKFFTNIKKPWHKRNKNDGYILFEKLLVDSCRWQLLWD
jgi:hypothetical protein